MNEFIHPAATVEDRIVAEPAKSLSPQSRWLSLAEFAIGSAIVIGHNVYHVIPNEVPILFVLGLISFRLRDGGWTAMGLGRPASWRRTLLIAIAAALLRIALSAAVIDPLTAHFWPPVDSAPMAGNRVDLRRNRRGDRISRLSSESRSRHGRKVEGCILDRGSSGVGALRLWSFL